MSRDSDLVSGSVGDPATTMTSVRPPLRAFLALRVFLSDRLFWYPLKATVPQTTMTTPVRTLCLATQFCTCSSRDTTTTATGGWMGGLGRMESGIHRDDASVSRTACAARSTFWSMKSATTSEYWRRCTGMLESCTAKPRSAGQGQEGFFKYEDSPCLGTAGHRRT